MHRRTLQARKRWVCTALRQQAVVVCLGAARRRTVYGGRWRRRRHVPRTWAQPRLTKPASLITWTALRIHLAWQLEARKRPVRAAQRLHAVPIRRRARLWTDAHRWWSRPRWRRWWHVPCTRAQPLHATPTCLTARPALRIHLARPLVACKGPVETALRLEAVTVVVSVQVALGAAR